MEKQHTGRISQTLIYLGKLFRMFVFQSDWKVLPMSAVIAAILAYVVSDTIFVTMEGTFSGAFALVCMCIWNGFFNSIQVICRERPIIKREHRSGLHMSSYVTAHLVYQAFICICQTVIILTILGVADVKMPEHSYVTGIVILDMGITIFIMTFAADVTALFVSAVVKNTTTAMTIMPFLMIFQLVFSGGFFPLQGLAASAQDFTIAKWGLTAICSQAEYNSLPNGTIYDAIINMNINDDDVQLSAETQMELSISEMKQYLQDENNKQEFKIKSGQYSQRQEYNSDSHRIIGCWIIMGFTIVLFSLLSVIALEFIDRDKR